MKTSLDILCTAMDITGFQFSDLIIIYFIFWGVIQHTCLNLRIFQKFSNFFRFYMDYFFRKDYKYKKIGANFGPGSMFLTMQCLAV
ncbi:hypothetical protein Dthio_PD2743 [Desulfonatronospira thiodismutans ASO3-1]|uniref:Uncharacterized protein n=1 Tax=Desulfonatronospira thiodismutans ASO3-1 TaxID=555779 RepID=D6SKW7_9BACT|nr:hypothetical protein Dthio_PD2743 [Desulfonatronospira thiodismutans ASO3-1]RQD76701.1 MAG: hypothetical protein D5S03_05630 [Desulfonatronospira sp. MSAO_Bac3]